jgi:hypothetical protein
VAHHNSDDVLHLVRLLGLGDEVAPELSISAEN